MSHLLKRTKKSCIKLIRKISNKQIFLKRLEEEDISNDIDVSQEATEKDINQNENQSPENIVSCYKKQRKAENKATAEDASKDNNNKRKLSIHFEEVSADKAVLQSLTSKLFLTADGYEFRRLQQLRSDTASEIVPYDPQFNKYKETTLESSALNGGDKKLEVVFEKVKYKEDVRYLRHTPSTCSLDNYIINDEDDEGDFMMMSATAIERNTNNMNSLNAAKDLEYATTTTNNTNNNNNTTTTRGLEMHNNHFASSSSTTNTALLQDHDQECNPYPYTHAQQHQSQSQSQTQPLNHLLPVNVSLGCITDGNYHQLIIGEERNSFYKLTPVVKWDINGNSLEDDDFPEFSIDGNCSPTKSSLRSSSTTLETWLEVE